MTKYRQLLEEILQGKSVDPVRKKLLGPRPLDPHKELKDLLPRRKRYVGPSAWYDALK